MGKQKFYVVWKGRETGIFLTWDDCAKQTKGFKDAKYRAFKALASAEQAYKDGWQAHYGKDIFETELSSDELALVGVPVLESISVDAAWNTQTGVVEYRGVDTKSKKELFHQGPFDDGTINIAEFLAIVHALAYLKKQGNTLPVYSDSRNAIQWIKNKAVNTGHEKSENNKKLFELISRALAWLNTNNYTNEILKWETKAWGENPADFGRK